MSLSFYMDVHVHKSVSDGLKARGIEVLRAQDDGCAEADDADLLDRAYVLGRVLVTFDQDFLAEAQRRQTEQIDFSGIVFSHQSKVETGQWIAELELLAACLDLDDVRNRVLFLPLR